MVKRMLIDSTHPEETRVVVVNGTRLEELDVETSTKRQIKGNIYLAKVVRVEPSLQAAFVDYGGNRHGFLAFSEIHPDYFQIPVADRQALLAAQRAEVMRDNNHDSDNDGEADAETAVPAEPVAEGENGDEPSGDSESGDGGENRVEQVAKPSHVETVGGDDPSDQEMERRRARLLRNYKIQEVIKRRQILLVQVVKEERGNKGAALTTYLSLAGRYCVLMPNTARGGGVSRKIINATDRRRLKAIATELDCPDGMAVIVRTAGSERSKAEIKRDYEYLLRAWDQVRELTLKSTAPAGVYEEASLIKRSIRDLYARDIDEVLVDGDEGYRLAKDYMRMLTPSHAKKVQPYKGDMPLFQRFQVENQLDAMHSPIVQLKSGGYIVIGQTEALVAIDVNSGRATKERHIEETAVKTNLEAADEIARQLRLRDLAGLIVIDFIDMEENRNNHAVERRVKEALKHDRARIQVGKISAFGLLELSRQRLRPSLQETAFAPCPHCAGTGLIRSVESAAMHVLRAIEEEGIRRRSSEVTVYVPSQIALYILNQKRDALATIEERYQFRVFLLGDDELIAPNLRMERVKAENRPDDARPAISMDANIPLQAPAEDEDDAVDEDEDAEAPAAGTDETAAEAPAGIEAESDEEAEPKGEGEGDNGEPRRKRRRRKRKRKAGDPSQSDSAANGAEDGAEAGEGDDEDSEDGDDAAEGRDGEDGDIEGESEADRRKRRRGRRGGRRRRRNRDGELPAAAEPAPVVPSSLPAVPGGELISNPDAVADVFERAERAAEAAAEAAEARIAAVTVPVADVPVAEVAVAAEGEDKPKRRRAPARKKADAEAAAPVAVAAEAELVTEAVAEAQAEAGAEAQAVAVAEDKPKRRGRKVAAATAEPEAASKPKVKAKKEPKAPAAAKAEPGADKPKAPRTRKPKAEAAAEPAEAVTAPVEAQPAPEAPAPVAKPAPVAVESDAEDAPAPARPTRKGWWNKLLS